MAMNREIKFRAWNPRTQVVTNGHSLYALMESTCKEDIEEFKNHQLIWMQCTGLKDKNGKEIYEGDILYEEDRNESWAVRWISENDGYDYEGWQMERTYSQNRHRAIVIGNIFENPELIKT